MATSTFPGPNDFLRSWAKITAASWDAASTFYGALAAQSETPTQTGEYDVPVRPHRLRPSIRDVVNTTTSENLDETRFFVHFTPNKINPEDVNREIEGKIFAYDPNENVVPGVYAGELWLDSEDASGNSLGEILHVQSFFIDMT